MQKANLEDELRRRNKRLKAGMDILSIRIKFFNSGLGSLTTNMNRRTWTRSNWPIRSSGNVSSALKERIDTFDGSQVWGGHWEILMSNPSRMAVGGRRRARSVIQVLHSRFRIAATAGSLLPCASANIRNPEFETGEEDTGMDEVANLITPEVMLEVQPGNL